MTADWNWFFSTLSQSTAAIVGIIGAFIIAKIFSNQAVFSEKNSRMKILIIEAEKILDKIGTIDFEWYNREQNPIGYKDALEIINKITSEDHDDISDEDILAIYESCSFSKFSDKGPILEALKEDVQSVCRYNKEQRLKKEQNQRDLADLEGGDIPGIGRLAAAIRTNTFGFREEGRKTNLNFAGIHAPWVPLNQELDLIHSCHLEAKHHARLVSDFLASIRGNPESPPQITWSLLLVGAIFLAGVIYPLTFMPATNSPKLGLDWIFSWESFFSVKSLLLMLLTLAFSVVFMMFTMTNISMKYEKKEVAKIQRLSNPNNYCTNFEILENSKKRARIIGLQGSDDD